MAAATKTTTRKRTSTVDVIELKPTAIKQELGRRRNNKERKQGEKARARAWYFPTLSSAEFQQVQDGETVRKSYSKRDVDFVLAPA